MILKLISDTYNQDSIFIYNEIFSNLPKKININPTLRAKLFFFL